MHVKSIKDHRFQQAFPKSVIDNGFIQITGLPSSVCVVDCAIDGFIGGQISFSKGDALVSKNRIK